MTRSATASTSSAPTTGFTWDDVDALVQQRAADALAAQQAFLAENPDFAPCVIPGCTGTVGPKYVTVVNGQRTGICPRYDAHKRLRAEHEASSTKRRGLGAA